MPDSESQALAEAIKEARLGIASGGIPIGSVLTIDGEIVGRGHNRRVQRGSSVLHAEMDCLENAGRLTAAGTQIPGPAYRGRSPDSRAGLPWPEPTFSCRLTEAGTQILGPAYRGRSPDSRAGLPWR